MASFQTDANRALTTLADKVRSRPKWEINVFCFLLTLLIGLVDYLLGWEITLSVAYAVPISIAAWFIGAGSAFVLSVLSILLWQVGDFAAGAQFSGLFIPVWNSIFRGAFYCVLVAMLHRLSRLQRNLEQLADERAHALAIEIGERERLQHEMLDISEREQRRIGQDLHDGLCQHLAAVALEGQLIADRLSEDQWIPGAGDIRKIVAKVQDAISMARGIAQGLYPIKLQAEGLMEAFEEFGARTSEVFGMNCRFECHVPVLIRDPSTATQLYRLTQEAVANALKHGHATDIVVSLEETDMGIELHIADNGSGLKQASRGGAGMGMRIMDDRAKVVGGTLIVGVSALGGVDVACVIPPGKEGGAFA
jgi:signal transduction histidine kinase